MIAIVSQRTVSVVVILTGDREDRDADSGILIRSRCEAVVVSVAQRMFEELLKRRQRQADKTIERLERNMFPVGREKLCFPIRLIVSAVFPEVNLR